MSLIDLMKQKFETQLTAYDEQLEAAQAEAKAKKAQAESDVAGAELEQQLLARVNELKDRIAEGRAYLEELAEAGDDKVEGIKAKLANFFSWDRWQNHPVAAEAPPLLHRVPCTASRVDPAIRY